VRWKYLRCVHRKQFLTNYLVKEFWKSVHICQSVFYQTSCGLLFWNMLYKAPWEGQSHSLLQFGALLNTTTLQRHWVKIFSPNLVQTCEPGQTMDNNCKTAFSLRRLQLRVIFILFYYFCTIFISVLLYTIKYDTIYSTCAQKRSKDKINEKIK